MISLLKHCKSCNTGIVFYYNLFWKAMEQFCFKILIFKMLLGKSQFDITNMKTIKTEDLFFNFLKPFLKITIESWDIQCYVDAYFGNIQSEPCSNACEGRSDNTPVVSRPGKSVARGFQWTVANEPSHTSHAAPLLPETSGWWQLPCDTVKASYWRTALWNIRLSSQNVKGLKGSNHISFFSSKSINVVLFHSVACCYTFKKKYFFCVKISHRVEHFLHFIIIYSPSCHSNPI